MLPVERASRPFRSAGFQTGHVRRYRQVSSPHKYFTYNLTSPQRTVLGGEYSRFRVHPGVSLRTHSRLIRHLPD